MQCFTTRLQNKCPVSLASLLSFPVDMKLAKKTAELKADRNMSYADCFAAALARLRKAELATGDKEFRQVEGDVKILWIA